MNKTRRAIVGFSFVNLFPLASPKLFAAITDNATKEWPSDASRGSIRLQTEELIEFLNSEYKVVVKSGIHLVNGPVIIKGRQIHLSGEKDAKIGFVDSVKGGFRIINSDSVEISNLKLQWPDGEGLPERDHYGAGILIVRSQNSYINDVQVFRAPGGGIQFDECTNSNVESAVIRWTGADGLHFANSNNSFANNIDCEYTGDDGVAFVDYRKKPKGEVFKLTNTKVVNSFARGIAVVGSCRGEVHSFVIDGASSNGLHIEQDAHYDTRSPHDVIVSYGIVKNAGALEPLAGNQHGMNILRASNINISNVQASSSLDAGVSVIDCENVQLSNCSSLSSGQQGIKVFRSEASFETIDISTAKNELFIASDCSKLSCTNMFVNGKTLKPHQLAMLLVNNKDVSLSNINLLEMNPSYYGRTIVLKGKQEGVVNLKGVANKYILNYSPLVSISSSV